MALLTTTVVDSLGRYDREALARVTGAVSVFLDHRFLAFLESLDLPPLLRGEASYRYVVVHRDGDLAALVPFLVTRSDSIYYGYSFPKAFFRSWPDQLAILRPDMARWVPWAKRVSTGVERIARVLGTGCEGWVLAVSPLTYRGGLAVDPTLAASERDAVAKAAIEGLKRVSVDERLVLCLFGVQDDDDDVRSAARGSGLDELFLAYDNYFDTKLESFDEYLAQFKAKKRNLIKTEIKTCAKEGVIFRAEPDVERFAVQFTELFDLTGSQFGDERFLHPPHVWPKLAEHLGELVTFQVAERRGELVGFSVLLDKGDLWVWRGGDRSRDVKGLYFSSTFYEPIRAAIARRCPRVFIGPSAYDTKHHRGGKGLAVYGYFGFPSRASRALLLPYLQRFTAFTRRTLSGAEDVHASFNRSHRDKEREARADETAGA